MTGNRKYKVYMAGPDVFLPDAAEIGRRKRELCERHGLVGICPLDTALAGTSSDLSLSKRIYHANIGLMLDADAIVANLTPFRGPSADAGTVYELGFMSGRVKPSFGYSNVPGSYFERAKAAFGGSQPERKLDCDGLEIEDFDIGDNLMIVHALDMLGAPLVAAGAMPASDSEKWRDLTQFEECLRLVVRHFE